MRPMELSRQTSISDCIRFDNLTLYPQSRYELIAYAATEFHLLIKYSLNFR